MDTGDWFAIVDLLVVFKVLFCVVLGDREAIVADLWDNGREPLLAIEFHPPEIRRLYVNHHRQVSINYSLTDDRRRNDSVALPTANASHVVDVDFAYVAKITSERPDVALPIRRPVGPPSNRTEELSIVLHVNKSNAFVIKAICIGHASIVVHVTSVLGSPPTSGYDDESSFNVSSIVATLAIIPYRVTVVRKLRLVDFIFDRTITVIAAMNSFSIGCVTDVKSLRMHFRHPTSILIAACCQFIITPIVSLVIAKMVRMTPELGLGLFYVACVPGGGMGHVIVSMVQGDRALSMAIHCFTTIMSIAMGPLWLFIMGHIIASSEIDLKLHWFVMWLVVSAGAYGLGIILRHLSAKSMDAYLNWFAKPFLLLYSILFVTLGVYINIYVFSVLDHKVMAGAASLPLFGYLIGMTISYIARQDSIQMKTIAIETTMFNSFLTVVIARFSLPQPDSDIAAALPIWIIFMTPIPLLLTNVVKQVQNSIWERCAKRREKKYRNFSIMSSLQNVTNITTLSSSMSPKLSSPADENCPSLIDEKITVL